LLHCREQRVGAKSGNPQSESDRFRCALFSRELSILKSTNRDRKAESTGVATAAALMSLGMLLGPDQGKAYIWQICDPSALQTLNDQHPVKHPNAAILAHWAHAEYGGAVCPHRALDVDPFPF
jgi:hypothetical protein